MNSTEKQLVNQLNNRSTCSEEKARKVAYGVTWSSAKGKKCTFRKRESRSCSEQMSTDPIWPTSPWFMVYGPSADTALFWGVINLPHLRADQLTLQSWQLPPSHSPVRRLQTSSQHKAEITQATAQAVNHREQQTIVWNRAKQAGAGDSSQSLKHSNGTAKVYLFGNLCSEHRGSVFLKKVKWSSHCLK